MPIDSKTTNNGYFEGVVQIRRYSPEQIRLVESMIRNDGAKISKKKQLKTGADLWVTSQKTIQKLEKNLRKQGALTKISRKLFTRHKQTGKCVYRLNLLIQFPLFSIGDCVAVDDQLFMVTSISKMVGCINLKTGKKKQMRLPEKSFKVIKPKKATVTLTKPRLEILEPDTYQSVICENPKNIAVKPGQKVKVAHFNEYYLLSA